MMIGSANSDRYMRLLRSQEIDLNSDAADTEIRTRHIDVAECAVLTTSSFFQVLELATRAYLEIEDETFIPI